MWVPAGSEFTATLVDPGGMENLRLGARIEVPVTRAIVGMWVEATLSGFVWSATMLAPPAVSAQGRGVNPAMDAALDAGEFELVWMDGGGIPAVEIFVPLHTTDSLTTAGGTVTSADWPAPDLELVTPSVEAVGALERTRMVDSGSDDQGTFGPDTRPTDAEAEEIIEQAVPVVLSQLRPTFPAEFYGQVSHAAALYAAILIEGSYYREQAFAEGSVNLYRVLYDQAISGMQNQIAIALQEQLAGSSGRLH